mmetsp:Transcript_63657/g.120516  ORF Transcript_63657/g.120516 Transcript_63657/m.120516 type:complete len:168 (-) Transcript_63657:247-750(-)
MKVIFLVCASACLQGYLAVKTSVQISASPGGLHFQEQFAGNESEKSQTAPCEDPNGLTHEKCAAIAKQAGADLGLCVADTALGGSAGRCVLTFKDGEETKAEPQGDAPKKWEDWQATDCYNDCMTDKAGVELSKKELEAGKRWQEPQVEFGEANWEVGNENCPPKTD